MSRDILKVDLLRHIPHPLSYEQIPSTTYNIWLPRAFPDRDVDISALGNTRLEDYKEFDHLIHGTHLQTAIRVVEDGKLSASPINDWSDIQTLFPGKCFTWIAPNTALADSCRYGSAILHFCILGSEGILRWTIGGDWRHYWMEVIDYRSQAASRIMVTYGALEDLDEVKANPSLLMRVKNARFDPRNRGGPWYWDERNNKHYYLPHSFRYKTQISQPHVVEFVRMDSFDFPRNALGISFVDHGLEGQRMTGYECKKFFSKCNENMSAKNARLCFYFTVYGRLKSKFDLSMFSHEEENQIYQDLIELVIDLKPNGVQTNTRLDDDQEQVRLLWFVLSRALGEGKRSIVRAAAKHFSQKALCSLISEKLRLPNPLSIDQTVMEETNDTNANDL